MRWIPKSFHLLVLYLTRAASEMNAAQCAVTHYQTPNIESTEPFNVGILSMPTNALMYGSLAIVITARCADIPYAHARNVALFLWQFKHTHQELQGLA